MPWIDNDSLLASLLSLNKHANETLKHLVFKQALLVSQPERLSIKRLPIWSYLLDIKKEEPVAEPS